MTRKNSVYIAVVTLLLYYLFYLQIKAAWAFTIDDMYISLRYARHLAEGHGLLWNINEAPVEGYSNFSFVLLGALAIKLGWDPVFILKSLGVLGLFFSSVGLFLLTRLWVNTYLAILPAVSFLVYRGQILWSVSGLETSVYQSLLIFSLYFLLRGLGYNSHPQKRVSPHASYLLIAAIVMIAMALTRNEGVLVCLLFYALACWDMAKPRKLMPSFLLWFLLYGVYSIWRYWYFAAIFPNPVLCKGLVTEVWGLMDKRYLILAWPFLLLCLPAIIYAKDKRHFYFWTPSLLYLVILISSDTIVSFDNRLFLPAFLLILPLALYGLTLIITKWSGQENTAIVTISAFLVVFFSLPAFNLKQYRAFTQNPQAGIKLRQQVALWLKNNVPTNSQVVLGDCGLIPYISDFNFIDSYCLNNKAMTQLQGADKYRYFCDHILQQKPAVVILSAASYQHQWLYMEVDRCLSYKLRDNPRYQLKKIFGNQEVAYRYEIFGI